MDRRMTKEMKEIGGCIAREDDRAGAWSGGSGVLSLEREMLYLCGF